MPRPSVLAHPIHARPHAKRLGKVLLRFKKLDRNLRTRSTRTEAQRAWSRQLYIPGCEEPATRLVAGYQLTDEQAQIARLAITCPRDEDSNCWFLELPDAGGFAEAAPVLPVPASPSEDSVKAKPKTAARILRAKRRRDGTAT